MSELRIGNSRVGSSPSESPGSGQFAQFLLLSVLGRFWYHRAVGRFWQPMYSFLISASVRGGVELHGAPARVTFISPRAASASRGIAVLCCCIKQRKKAFKFFKSYDSFMWKTDRYLSYSTEDLKCKGCFGYKNDTLTQHLFCDHFLSKLTFWIWSYSTDKAVITVKKPWQNKDRESYRLCLWCRS